MKLVNGIKKAYLFTTSLPYAMCYTFNRKRKRPKE